MNEFWDVRHSSVPYLNLLNCFLVCAVIFRSHIYPPLRKEDRMFEDGRPEHLRCLDADILGVLCEPILGTRSVMFCFRAIRVVYNMSSYTTVTVNELIVSLGASRDKCFQCFLNKEVVWRLFKVDQKSVYPESEVFRHSKNNRSSSQEW